MMIMQHINLMAHNKDEVRTKNNVINQTGFRVVDVDSHKPQEE
jgi:Tfp pilus assembly PilM family ATPase